jgi:hypothetical protein
VKNPCLSPILSPTLIHDTTRPTTRHDTTRHTGGWLRRDSSARRTASYVRRCCPRGGTARALPRRSCAASRRSVTAIAWASTAALGSALPPARSACAVPAPKVRLTRSLGPHRNQLTTHAHHRTHHRTRAHPPHTYTTARDAEDERSRFDGAATTSHHARRQIGGAAVSRAARHSDSEHSTPHAVSSSDFLAQVLIDQLGFNASASEEYFLPVCVVSVSRAPLCACVCRVTNLMRFEGRNGQRRVRGRAVR